MLRSGLNYERPEKKQPVDEEAEDQDQQAQAEAQIDNEPEKEKATEGFQEKEAGPMVNFDHQIKIPYPQRLRKSNLDKQFTKFLEVFKRLNINIPFAEALEHIPSYVKFMKGIYS